MINGFKGEYKFLSNFYKKDILYNGILYKSSEHAYQALKSTNKEDHDLVSNQQSPRMSKKIGSKIKVRSDWEDIKYNIMMDILRVKFKDPILSKMLLNTNNKFLKETNNWHDNTWGDCVCDKCKENGKNWLGEILMKIRKENKNNKI